MKKQSSFSNETANMIEQILESSKVMHKVGREQDIYYANHADKPEELLRLEKLYVDPKRVIIYLNGKHVSSISDKEAIRLCKKAEHLCPNKANEKGVLAHLKKHLIK